MTENNENSHSSGELLIELPTADTGHARGYIFFLVCAILILSVIGFGAVDFWAMGLLSVLVGLIIAGWIYDAWKRKSITFAASMLQFSIIGLILIGLIQLLPLRSVGLPSELLPIPAVSSLSFAPYATRMAVAQLFLYLVFFGSALLVINSRARLRKMVLTIIIFGSLMAFFGILQRLADTDSIYGVRPTLQAIPFASFVNQHHFAAFMEMTIAFPLALLFGKATASDKRLLLIVSALIMGIAIVFTSSRGGMLGLMAVLGFVVMATILVRPFPEHKNRGRDREKKFRRYFAVIGGGLALVLVLVGLVLLLGGDQALMRGAGLASSGEDLSSGRIHFWNIALQIFRDHPIIGAGLDSFGTVFTHYDTWNGQFRVEQAHNDYLQILADAGIAGFACVAAFIFLLFKNGLRTIGESGKSRFRRSTAIGALAGCFGVLLHSFFDFPLRTPSNAFFFLTLAVLATAAIHTPKRRRRNRKV